MNEPAPQSCAITVDSWSLGPYGTNTYLITAKAGEGDPLYYLVDAPLGADTTLYGQGFFAEKKLQAIFLTHSHLDHTAALHAIHQIDAVPVWVHEADLLNVTHPGSDRLGQFLPQKVLGVAASSYEKEESFSGLPFRMMILHTPGHSPGSVCLYLPDHGMVFSGDTLFRSTIGRTDLPTSDPALMRESLLLLKTLPSETRVLPGHGAPSNILTELPTIARFTA